MAHFQASLTENNIPAISLDATTGIITFVDSSNYGANTDPGHTLSNFSVYRRFVVLDFNNVATVYDAEGNGGVTIQPPSTAPDSGNDPQTYQTDGDGVYTVTLYTVPVYNSGVSYSLGDQVWYAGSFYNSLQNSNSANTPGSAPSWWSLLGADASATNPDFLSSKYRVWINFSITTALINCWMNAVVSAANVQYSSLNPCKNEDMMRANQMDMILTAININATNGKWDEVTALITQAQSICNC
jgi:hypothetical protein